MIVSTHHLKCFQYLIRHFFNNKLKQEYFNHLLINDAKRPKEFWKPLKTLVPNGKNTKTSVKRLVTDVTSPKGIADHFNKLFVNVGVTLAYTYIVNNPPVSEKLFTFSKTDTKCVDGIGIRILKASYNQS